MIKCRSQPPQNTKTRDLLHTLQRALAIALGEYLQIAMPQEGQPSIRIIGIIKPIELKGCNELTSSLLGLLIDVTILRLGKLPLGELMPVQMCRSIQQVAEVMRDGLPKDKMDDDLSEMDRLADML